MNEHTPGPWSEQVAIPGFIATAELPICNMAQGNSQWKANARLIAVAPDLLQLVQLFTTLHMDIGDDHEELEEKLYGWCKDVLDKIGASPVPS